MAEFQMYLEFDGESEAREVLSRFSGSTQVEELKKQNQCFRLVESIQADANSRRVVKICMSYFVSWDVAGIAAALRPGRITRNYRTIWPSPDSRTQEGAAA